MSTATRTVCDQCQGVIPSGAPHISGVSATLILATGPQTYSDLDFCCASHMGEYIAAQPNVPDPAQPYPPIPAE